MAANFWPRNIDEQRFPGFQKLYDTAPGTKFLWLSISLLPIRGAHYLPARPRGSGDAGYIKSLAQAALERGFAVHRSNMRTCGGTETLSDTMYHSGLTSDTLHVVEQLVRRDTGPVFLVGSSLGGNVVLKLAGELGHSNILGGVCAVSAPIGPCLRCHPRQGF